MKKNDKNLDSCLFWTKGTKECGVCKDGLFIPLEDHIEAFCTSPNYRSCLQYSLHAPKNIPSAVLVDEVSNRRQSLRIKLNNSIELKKIIQSDVVVEHLSEKVETLDISTIGMRLLTDFPLTKDTVIQFAFNEKFPPALRKGAGLVEWCNKQIDEPGYHAGISFQSNQLLKAMDNFLAPHLCSL